MPKDDTFNFIDPNTSLADELFAQAGTTHPSAGEIANDMVRLYGDDLRLKHESEIDAIVSKMVGSGCIEDWDQFLADTKEELLSNGIKMLDESFGRGFSARATPEEVANEFKDEFSEQIPHMGTSDMRDEIMRLMLVQGVQDDDYPDFYDAVIDALSALDVDIREGCGNHAEMHNLNNHLYKGEYDMAEATEVESVDIVDEAWDEALHVVQNSNMIRGHKMDGELMKLKKEIAKGLSWDMSDSQKMRVVDDQLLAVVDMILRGKLERTL